MWRVCLPPYRVCAWIYAHAARYYLRNTTRDWTFLASKHPFMRRELKPAQRPTREFLVSHPLWGVWACNFIRPGFRRCLEWPLPGPSGSGLRGRDVGPIDCRPGDGRPKVRRRSGGLLRHQGVKYKVRHRRRVCAVEQHHSPREAHAR